MKTNKEIAQLFSGGRFTEAADQLASDVEWHIYENNISLQGKAAVLAFCKNVADYFKSVITQFEQLGMLEENNRIAIYGSARFIRDGETINAVQSCDVYEFDTSNRICKIYSYCNSSKSNE